MLYRTARRSGNSVIVSLPAQVVDMYEIKIGDKLCMSLIGNKTVGITKCSDIKTE